MVKNPPAMQKMQEMRVQSLGQCRKIPWKRQWRPTPVFLPGKSHGQRSLRGYIHGVTKSRTWLSMHTRDLFSHQVVYNPMSLWPYGLWHTRLPRPILSPRVCSNSCPLSQWWDLTILSSVVPFSFCLQSFPALGSFPVSQLFTSGGQSFGASASASASVLPMNIQGWFPLGLTGLISFQSKGLWRVFSCTTIQKQQFFGTQSSLWSNSYIRTWLLEKP